MTHLSISGDQIIHALASCEYNFAGIRSAFHAQPDGPVFPIAVQHLDYLEAFNQALAGARNYWPKTYDFEIVGAYGLMAAAEGVPAGADTPHTIREKGSMVHYSNPQQLVHFRLQQF